MRRVIWCFVIVAGCATEGDDGPSCGDGVCSVGESTASCASDCPINGPRCGDGVCNGQESSTSCSMDCHTTNVCTTSPDNCAGETICIAGACEAAFPRVYRITNVRVAVPTTNPNAGNSDWDVGGGAPDLYIGDSTGVAITAPVDNSFSATFQGPFDIQLVAGGAVRIYVWDEDVTAHDFAMGCVADPATATLLRTRSFSCAGGGSTLMATIGPK